jgi:hypothetical protein
VDSFAALNPSLGVDTTFIEAGDLGAGWIDVRSSTDPLHTAVPPDTFNAVQVIARRSSEGLNGGIPLLFARVFGYSTSRTWASAVAVLNDRVGGFDLGEFQGPSYLLPFTLHEDVFYEYLSTGPDDFGFDANDHTVTSSGDGIREIKLYPHDSAPGNFGLLNIGAPNEGTPTLREYIEFGVPAEAVEAEIGSSVLTFYDDNGNPVTYEIDGTPGLVADLDPSVDLRVGDVIGFLLHDQYVDEGSNAIYNITDIRFARVMDNRLQGASFMRGIWLQPVSYAGPGIILNPAAPPTDGLSGRIVLVR